MSMKALRKTNKFYIVFGIVVITTAALLIYIFKGLFSSMSIAYDVDINVPEAELKVNKDQLNTAYDMIINRETVKLEVR